MSVEIRRGTSRFTTREPGRHTRHSFSFGQHYDPERVSFGRMTCHDDHHLRPGSGFSEHHHAGLEIVTWVLTGALEHTDSLGHTATTTPGTVAVQHAGAGVDHAEVAAQGVGATRFVQVWLTPDDDAVDAPASFESLPVDPEALASGDLVDTGARPRSGDARLLVARLPAGGSVTLPVAPLVHCFVARGALVRSSLAEPLEAGDAFLLDGETEARTVTAAVATELLVWTLPAR
ncbi:pirin family protein [Nocardioides bruguierae]|uniref:pirin family protein n=1 Tax=Nocardioides bruguierae TaxID=2945102 RepID=UPI0020203A00|nr:pirin family protein [Nocardioides bruguierae]MCL8024100.1 pirin family protein [Nocardioides bruguierae]